MFKLWKVIKYTLGVLLLTIWGYAMVKLLVAYPDMTPKQQEQFHNMLELMGD